MSEPSSTSSIFFVFVPLPLTRLPDRLLPCPRNAAKPLPAPAAPVPSVVGVDAPEPEASTACVEPTLIPSLDAIVGGGARGCGVGST